MTALLTVAGLAAALLTVGALARGAWSLTRRVVYIADAVSELVPNGGGSIKDQVTRIEARLDEHLAEHEHDKEAVR